MRLARAAALVAILSLIGASPASAADPVTLRLEAPATADLGARITLIARLADAGGRPMPKASIVFTVTESFLNTSSAVVVAEAVTDKDGAARASFAPTSTGALQLGAHFAGDAHYGPADASGTLNVPESGTQLTSQHAGVRIPGLNEVPGASTTVALGPGPFAALARLWPGASVWPILLVLGIVWSLYAFVISLLFRIARSGAVVS